MAFAKYVFKSLQTFLVFIYDEGLVAICFLVAVVFFFYCFSNSSPIKGGSLSLLFPLHLTALLPLHPTEKSHFIGTTVLMVRMTLFLKVLILISAEGQFI